jgi:hypothetical protein
MPHCSTTTSTNAIASTNATTTPVVTDIAILNPGDEDITLPPTSTVVIGINEIEKGAEHAHEEGVGTQAGTTRQNGGINNQLEDGNRPLSSFLYELRSFQVLTAL